MHPVLEQLITLQAIDLDLKRLREQLAEAPRRVSAAEAGKKQAESVQSATQAKVAQEDALRRRQESDIADHRNKLTRLRKQLDAATSAQQVSAYERELAFGEEAIRKLEDDELASMERTEGLETELTAHRRTLELADAALQRARSNAVTLTERNKPEVAALESERAALRKQMSDSDEGETPLATYDRVTKAKSTGISEALDHKCSACQMLVRPQRWNDLTSREHANEMYHCESCGRFLFWDPRRDTPGDWSPGDRLTRAKAAAAV